MNLQLTPDARAYFQQMQEKNLEYRARKAYQTPVLQTKWLRAVLYLRYRNLWCADACSAMAAWGRLVQRKEIA